MMERRVPIKLYDNGKTYAEDGEYVLRFQVTTHGITREYGRRRNDNKMVLLNVQEVFGQRMENLRTDMD